MLKKNSSSKQKQRLKWILWEQQYKLSQTKRGRGSSVNEREGQMLTAPPLQSSDLHLSVIKCKCRNYDGWMDGTHTDMCPSLLKEGTSVSVFSSP